jgi:hypothetical protein
MPRNGRRHRLILYTFMLDRWWRFALGIGIAFTLLVAWLGILPGALPKYHFLWVSDWVLWVAGGVGVAFILLGIFLILIRKSAYVQPFENHLLLATPILRMNISYRRIRQASSVEMQRIFPVEKYKGIKRRLLRPFAKKTAILLDLNGWPMPRWVLNLFLSPFFFPDRTARLAILVPDWMEFSTDMESFRGVWLDSQRQVTSSPQSDLLRNILKSRKR